MTKRGRDKVNKCYHSFFKVWRILSLLKVVKYSEYPEIDQVDSACQKYVKTYYGGM